jgi:hypothetical protein
MIPLPLSQMCSVCISLPPFSRIHKRRVRRLVAVLMRCFAVCRRITIVLRNIAANDVSFGYIEGRDV